MKKIIRIVYIAFGLIVSLLIFMNAYRTQISINLSNIMLEGIQDFDETKDMAKIAQSFGLWQNPIDKKPCAEGNTGDGKNYLAVYPTANSYSVEYQPSGTDSKKVTINKVEEAYLVMLVHPHYDMMDVNETNKSGLQLIDEDGNSYTYLFNQSATVNKSTYKDSPKTELEACLNDSREYGTIYIEGGFDLIAFVLPKTLMKNIMESKLGSKEVVALNVLNNVGTQVYETNIEMNATVTEKNFDYKQPFFTDMAGFLDMVNVYNSYVLAEDKEVKESLKEAAENAEKNFISKYYEDPDLVIEGFNSKYMVGIKRDQVYNYPKLVLIPAGYMLITIAILSLLYLLLFHFDLFRSLFVKISQAGMKEPEEAKKTATMRKASDVAPQKATDVIDAEVIDVNVEETKTLEPATIEENKSEEVNE